MEKKDIKTVQTTQGELRFYRDWDGDGYDRGIIMMNAQTIKRYRELQDQKPNCDEYGVFYAFSNKEFEEGVTRLMRLGFITNKSELEHEPGTGLFGTPDGIRKYFAFQANKLAAIANECDPQEVYFYEFNKHDCMNAWNGDSDAIKVVINYWSEETAESIIRFNASKSEDNII